MNENIENELDGNEIYRLTPYGCISAVCNDYNIDISHITPKMGEHLFNDFIELLIKQGYICNEVD